MKTMNLTQSEFAAILKSANCETCESVFENEVFYNQITIDDVTYRCKALTLKPLNLKQLTRKANSSRHASEPVRLRDKNKDTVIAHLYNSKTTLYYHLPSLSHYEQKTAKESVICYAKSIVARNSKAPTKMPMMNCAA